MNRRDFLLSAAAAAKPASPPNVLFIMPDQWRGQDLGCAGNREVRTANFDRLAAEGVLLPNLMANSPVCTPARSMLATGRYCYRTGTAVNDVPLANEEVTIAEVLAARGYYTGFVGKWHLQGGRRQPGFVPPGPRRQGFEYWAANICNHSYFSMKYFRDDPAPIPIEGYDAPGWTNLAIEFLRNAAARSKPFCLYLQYPTPHNPYPYPPGFENLYDPEKIELRKNYVAGAKQGGTRRDIAGYYAAIACLDREVGRLLAAVDELALRDNTIVLVTSDHGNMLGSHQTFNKRKPWEESVRVPGIIRWPRGIRAGQRGDAVVSHVDVVPTLLGMCGAPKPRNLDGFDFSSYLRSGMRGRTPDFAYLMSHVKTESNEWDPWRGLRTRRWKYARFRDRRWMLHDLDADPYELTNLADSRTHENLMAGFDRRIADHMRRTGDRWDELHDAPYQ